MVKKTVNFKYTCSFQVKILPNLLCVLIYPLTKCLVEDGFKDCKKISVTGLTVKEVTISKVAFFVNDALRQIYFVGIYEIFNITKS